MMSKMNNCNLCSVKDAGPEHYTSEKHMRNSSLRQFAENKAQFINVKKGTVAVPCEVKSNFQCSNYNQGKIKVSAKPGEQLVFKFTMHNESSTDVIYVRSVNLIHTHFNFEMNNHSLNTGCQPQRIAPRSKLPENIIITFSSSLIGQYETPVIFNFQKKLSDEIIFIMKELVVYVEQSETVHANIISPYERKEVWAKELLRSSGVHRRPDHFRIPPNFKKIYCSGLKAAENADPTTKELTADIRQVFATGITSENYIKFFRNVLWYEETIIRMNLKRYNMTAVNIKQQQISCGTAYALVVPGLGEKRPSLLLGDLLFIKPHGQIEVMFEATVKEINENVALIGSLNGLFINYFSPDALYDVRFFMSRVPLERMHSAVTDVKIQCQEPRIFPQENSKINPVKPIIDFFLVENNLEQRCAVERMLAGTSGTAPYLLHGPPGTGKTVTVVETVLQLVLKNPSNRIMICTDSNMAADHVATMLVHYSHMFSTDRWLLRASSKFRTWETLPACLADYSNGTSRSTFTQVPVQHFVSYSIVITTLSHAAKFARHMSDHRIAHHITHLFIDEAAQASEPSCLIPVCGMLRPNGQLVLAGDPHQLGPVVISHNAAKIGLGVSLMERLKKTCPLYSDIRNDPNYIVMLRNNFRSNPDILEIPDKLFYNGQLRALAKEDNISNIDILGEKQHSRAIVFHGVMSKEQKIGKSPSFFNMMECEMVQLYVKRLVQVHNVSLDDIGIVTPYIRQVYQIKKCLQDVGYDKIEVGTVEAYQGKEKRIIIISTVRANCNLLDHDAKFQLGFLVDDKRFNVAITRAKAKVIIIGNPLCLEKDIKWRMYMQRCRELGTYHGFDSMSLDEEGRREKEIYDCIVPLLNEIKVGRKIQKRK